MAGYGLRLLIQVITPAATPTISPPMRITASHKARVEAFTDLALLRTRSG
jgi:hypothetical protein